MRRPRAVAAAAAALALVATLAVATAAGGTTPVPSTIRLGAVHHDEHHAVEATVVRAVTDLAPSSPSGSVALLGTLAAALAIVCGGRDRLRPVRRRTRGLVLAAATAARGPPPVVAH